MKLYGLTDIDHASDDESRRSVSCSQEFLGCHLLDQEVGRQTCVAISFGEGEFHALTLCAARLMFTKNLVEGFGFPLVEGPVAYSDSSAARGIANRKSVGEARASSSQKSLVATGQSGWTGESRQGRHAAEYCRLGRT